jgi:hypothetical protein
MVEQAIVNASPIILLSRIGRLELLRSVARIVCVPVSVVDEVGIKGGEDMAAQALLRATWATRVDPGSVPAAIAAWNLGAGGSAVLAVARRCPVPTRSWTTARLDAVLPRLGYRRSGRSESCSEPSGWGPFRQRGRSWSVWLPSACT